MAAALPISLSIEALCEHFQRAVNTPQTILNENLLPIPGRFSACNHNKILTAALHCLERTTAESIPRQGLLILLKDAVLGYINKAQTASSLAKRRGGKSNTPAMNVAVQLFEKISMLHAEVMQRDSQLTAPPNAGRHINQTQGNEEALFRNRLSAIATEWYVFRALEFTSTLLDSELQCRKELLNLQYRFSRTKGGIAVLPPLSFFESPWPILLLGIRYGKAMRAGPWQMDKYKSLIFRLAKAKQLYPEHREVIEGLFLDAQCAEYKMMAGKIVPECGITLDTIRDSIPRGSLGPAMEFAIDGLEAIKTRFKELGKTEGHPFSTPYMSEEKEFAAGEIVEAREAELNEQLSSLFKQSIVKYKEIFIQNFDSYDHAFAQLQKLHFSHPHIQSSSGKDMPLKFTPFFRTPLFFKTSEFFNNIASNFPSPEEIRTFPQIAYKTLVMKFCQEFEAMQQELTRAQKLEFLPKTDLSASHRQKTTVRKKKKSPPNDALHHLPTNGSLPSLTQSIEHLSLEHTTAETLCSPSPKQEDCSTSDSSSHSHQTSEIIVPESMPHEDLAAEIIASSPQLPRVTTPFS